MPVPLQSRSVGACCPPLPAVSSSGSNSPCSPASTCPVGISQLTVNSFRCLALRGQTHTWTTQNQSKILIRTFPHQPLKSKKVWSLWADRLFSPPSATLRRTFADRNHYSHSQAKLLSSSPTPIINISQSVVQQKTNNCNINQWQSWKMHCLFWKISTQMFYQIRNEILKCIQNQSHH